MNRVEYNCWTPDEDVEVVVTHDLPIQQDQSTTIIKVNADGIIIDFYQDGEMTSTIGMTYEEWFDLSERIAGAKEKA